MVDQKLSRFPPGIMSIFGGSFSLRDILFAGPEDEFNKESKLIMKVCHFHLTEFFTKEKCQGSVFRSAGLDV